MNNIILSLVAIIVSGIAILVSIITYVHSVYLKKREMSVEAYSKLHSDICSIYTKGLEIDAGIDLVNNNDSEKIRRAKQILTHYDIFSSAVNEKIYDTKTIKIIGKIFLKNEYNLWIPFINTMRNNGDSTFCSNFEYLVNELSKEERINI